MTDRQDDTSIDLLWGARAMADQRGALATERLAA